MAALHEALKCLTPTSWDSVPTHPNEIRAYIDDISTKARLIIESVPEPPPPEHHSHHNTNNGSASSPSSRMNPSTLRVGTTDEATLALQHEWGKPIKINSAKDNPLEIPVYKLPGIDGNGHWFSRRSVHEGLPFSRWQAKLSSEMMETLKTNQERMREGKPPDQSVRGIGAEKQIEEIEVLGGPDEGKSREGGKKGRVLGKVNVLHVSAQFPRPTTPRDFVTMIIDWETELGEPSGGVTGEGPRKGRNWMMVSRPCEHPDVPPSQGYIRGQYESVEFIREIPVEDNRPVSGSATDGNGGEDDWNPVEWIMVTRSDPGGNIPRWMVEKGTPRSICNDAVKFLDWACEGMPKLDSSRRQRMASEKSESSQATAAGDQISDEGSSDTDITEPEHEEHHGLIASCVYLLNTGLERYAPQTVLNYLPRHLRHPTEHWVSRDASKTSNDAHEILRNIPNQVVTGNSAERDADNGSQISTNSGFNSLTETNIDISPAEVIRNNKTGKLSSHEKQLAKLAQQKYSIEAQLELIQKDIQSLRLRPTEEETRRERAAALASVDNPSTERVSSSPSSLNSRPGLERNSSSNNHHPRNDTPTRETARMHKVASSLFHDESKLLRQLGKIEKQQVKEASKIEAEQRKKDEKKEKSRSRTENECLRREVENLKKELEKLKGERRKWLDLIGSLQTENKQLANKVSQGHAK